MLQNSKYLTLPYGWCYVPILICSGQYSLFFFKDKNYKAISKTLTFKLYKVLFCFTPWTTFFFWPICNYAENILDFKVLLIKATQSARDSARSPPQPLFVYVQIQCSNRGLAVGTQLDVSTATSNGIWLTTATWKIKYRRQKTIKIFSHVLTKNHNSTRVQCWCGTFYNSSTFTIRSCSGCVWACVCRFSWTRGVLRFSTRCCFVVRRPNSNLAA